MELHLSTVPEHAIKNVSVIRIRLPDNLLEDRCG